MKTTGEMVIPGVMDVFRDPRNAENWGKASVDVALLATSFAKLGRAAQVGRTARLSEELTALGKAGKVTHEVAVTERFSIIEGNATHIWTATKQRTPVQNAYRHWKAHRSEFPSLHNSSEYVHACRTFVQDPPAGVLIKKRLGGDVVFYEPNTNTFAVTNEYGIPRTMFKPDSRIHGYPTNLEYFHAQ